MSFLFAIFFAGSIVNSGPAISAPIEFTYSQSASVLVGDDIKDVTEATHPLNPDGRVAVSNVNGKVEVIGWDRPEVHLVTTKIASSRERLDDVEVNISARQDFFGVEVDYKRRKGKWVRNDKLQVNFKLMVPRTAVVDEVESVNGNVIVTGLTNKVVVSAVNGAVRGTELRGDVKLSTVNGSVVATFEELAADSEVYLGTVNGSAQILMPSNVNATVKADSVNGSISNEFGLPVRKGKYVGRDLYGKIGTGMTKVNLTTVNGSIKIRRNEDGMPLNPVKNLLKQKTSDDFDDAFQSGIKVKVDDANALIDAEVIARESIKASKVMEIEAMRESERLAVEAVTANAETIGAAIADVRAIDIDQAALDAEIASITRTATSTLTTPYILEDSKTVEVKGVPTVQIRADGCNVSVKGWDKNKVKYVVSRLAKGRTSPVKNISFNQEKSGITLDVRVLGPASAQKVLDQVRVEVFVPRESNLTIKTDREIRLNGVTGELDLNGKNGGIDVRDSSGTLDVESWNGLVRVIGFKGDLDSRIGSADMYLDGDFSNITSHSKSGRVYLIMGDDPGAMIKTNAMAIEGVTMRIGKPVIINGMSVTNKSNNLWQVGNGDAEYNFHFNSGRLILRPRADLGAE